MNKQMAQIVLLWHGIYVDLTKCIESARVVLDQTDRGTLLPDRVREMRGELLAVQEKIPPLADLMEELTGETLWPMKPEETIAEGDAGSPSPGDEEASAERIADIEPPGVTAEGDYDAEGATPPEASKPSAELYKGEVAADEESAAEADATGTP